MNRKTFFDTIHIGGDATNANAFAMKLESTLVNAMINGANLLKSTYQNDIIDNSTGNSIFISDVRKNAGWSQLEFDAEVQTTDASATTIWSYTPAADELVHLRAFVSWVRDGYQSGGAYSIHRAARSDAGVVTILANPDTGINPETAGEDATGPQAVMTVSGGNVLLRVTGIAAATFDWYAKIEIQRRRP